MITLDKGGGAELELEPPLEEDAKSATRSRVFVTRFLGGPQGTGSGHKTRRREENIEIVIVQKKNGL